MKLRRWKEFLLISTVLLWARPVLPRPQQQRINVSVENASAVDKTYELYDNVCNAPMTLQLNAHQTSTLSICSTGAVGDGFGSLKARQKGTTIWNNFDLVRNGQQIILN